MTSYPRTVGAIIKSSPMRICYIAVLALLAPASIGSAQSATTTEVGDLALTLSCPTAACRFRQGEVIQLKFTFTATRTGYGMHAADGLRQRGLDSFTATPSNCVADPLEGSTVWINPSHIFGVPHLFPEEPFSVTVELNQWVRIGCPGKYQISAQSSRVFRESGSPLEERQQRLVSKPIDIEIVVADAQWQKEQLARILPELPSPGAGYSAPAAAAVRALGYLGSDEALREIRTRISYAPFTSDFRNQNNSYLLDWEMARLELLRQAALLPRHR
jgi:hypothetical protein